MSFAAMIGRRRQLVVPTLPDEPEEPPPDDVELLATFSATEHAESSGAPVRWTQNGVTGYNRRYVERVAFTGGSPSGSHAYRLNYGDSVGNVEGGVSPGGIAEFGLVFPEDYGDELWLQWEQYVPSAPDDPNGPPFNVSPGEGLGQFKVLRAWPLVPGESLSEDGAESYGSDAKMGFSEYSAAGCTATYGFRYYNDGEPANAGQGGDPWFIVQHPPSGARDQLIVSSALRGRWVTCRARLKVATTEVTDEASPSDGVAQFWADGVLLNGSGTDFRNFPGEAASRNWRYAYLLGARDGKTYPGECLWIDNVKVFKGGFPS